MLYLRSFRLHDGLPGITSVSQFLVMCRVSHPAAKTLQHKDIHCIYYCTHEQQFRRYRTLDKVSCLSVLKRKWPYFCSALLSGCNSRSIHGCLRSQELAQQRQKFSEIITSQRAPVIQTPVRHLFYEKDAKSGYGGKVCLMVLYGMLFPSVSKLCHFSLECLYLLTPNK